jgi:hypothetical protein
VAEEDCTYAVSILSFSSKKTLQTHLNQPGHNCSVWVQGWRRRQASFRLPILILVFRQGFLYVPCLSAEAWRLTGQVARRMFEEIPLKRDRSPSFGDIQISIFRFIKQKQKPPRLRLKRTSRTA